MDLKAIYLLVISISAALAQDDWEKQCNRCHCLWVSGKKSANCANRDLNIIPDDLSGEIREIDFSNNFFTTLEQKVFSNAHLGNIHKLKLQNCTIRTVNQWAFSGLGLIIELDLSLNLIAVLNQNVFRSTDRLRSLTLSHNKIRLLEDGLFYNMTYLQKILLDHNEIETVSRKTFELLPSLKHISLANNKIRRIEFDMKLFLPKLSSMSLEGNPWVCDCRLRRFRESSQKNSLITSSIVCQEPSRLKDVSWLEDVVFACEPKVVEVGPLALMEVSTGNVTLTCKVTGEPEPDVDWMTNGATIEQDPRKNKQKYLTHKNKANGFAWNNLTILNVNYKDRGDYKCVAKNSGGESDKNVTVVVTSSSSLGIASGGLSTNTYLIIGISIGFLVVLLIVLVILFCFCRRSTHGFHAKRRNGANGSEEYIHMNEGQAEIKKGLITDVNPVSKPPRTSLPPSVVSGGTEVSDAKRNLLDSDSVFYDCDDETRSLDFDQPLLRKSQPLADPSHHRPRHPYPPDLLPFPPSRVPQISPAGSSASTVADTTRLPPPHGPQSPLHSPIYDQLGVYRTLPYSRSHSPFVGPPARVPRQGYVTIPRRPRQQSWSSEPPNMSDITSEPLYDNLGLRTTVDGGLSTTSLNKVESSATSTPRSVRLLPLSPTSCDPIAESHESPPGPPKSDPPSHTLPRAPHHNPSRLTPSKLQWTMDNAEALRSPDNRDSTISLPSEDSKQAKKIPPRPPPKPKKRLSTGGPLFEDEGEDGTEV